VKEPANLELAIALPLGVVANQLTRIEADLRFLSMKTSVYTGERESGELAAKVSGGLEKISAALDLIRAVVADMEASAQPTPLAGKASRDRPSRNVSADLDD
jgi:hypothetical protein